jgi:hypothetical protein
MAMSNQNPPGFQNNVIEQENTYWMDYRAELGEMISFTKMEYTSGSDACMVVQPLLKGKREGIIP